ncbi:MAG: hypothetical protein ABEJ61_08505 [Haloferacaceae archaeon]
MVHERDGGRQSEVTRDDRPASVRALDYVRLATQALAAVLGVSLLLVGTVGVIAELKGTWHWAIHFDSTISFMAVFVSGVLALLVPLFGTLLVGRWWVDA